MTTETRPIPGFEGFYQVTADGRVWSERRTVVRSDGRPMTCGGRWLRTIKHSEGYLSVHVYRGRGMESLLVHRAVALAWLPRPSDDGALEVNHKDGDKARNVDTNLEWVTSGGNKLHAWRSGLRGSSDAHKAAARRNHRPKLDAEQVRAIRTRISRGEPHHAIGRDFRVSTTTIWLISHNRRYAGIL